MTLTEYLDAIAEKLGVTNLPDRLLTTYLEAFAKHEGVDVSALPDNLVTTYLNAILKAKGVQPVKDNMLTAHLEAISGAYGAVNLPDRLISTYLEAIIANMGGGKRIKIVITGDEEFTFSSANKAVYFMHKDIAGATKECIVNVTCAHYKYGDGIVLAAMKDGEFIFNCSTTDGIAITTGNVSFKNSAIFTSKNAAAAWFKEQYANGTPVTIECEVFEWEYVPYLQSSGEQAIETGYVVGEDDVLEMSYELTNTSASGDKFMFGSHAQSGTSVPGLWCETYGNNNKWYVRFGSTSSTSVESTKSNLNGTLTLKKSSFTVNGENIATPAFSEMPVGTLALFIRKNASGEYVNGAYMKCYGFKITSGDTIIHEYKPARRLADGALGMYDTVTRQFLFNVGTGSFVTE